MTVLRRLTLSFLFSLVGLTTLCVQEANSAPRPNIVLIMCDDMGFSDIGCYGGEVQTPTLDRLAHEGMRFTQFYNNAKCTTTRASLITGLYPRRKGGLLRRNMVTLGEAMGVAGYHTILSGKWHLGSGDDTASLSTRLRCLLRPAGRLLQLLQSMHSRIPSTRVGKVRSFGQNDQRITQFPPNFYTTDAFTDHAIAQVRAAVAEKQAVLFAHLLHGAALPSARQAGRHRKISRQVQDGLGRHAPRTLQASDRHGTARSHNLQTVGR